MLKDISMHRPIWVIFDGAKYLVSYAVRRREGKATLLSTGSHGSWVGFRHPKIRRIELCRLVVRQYIYPAILKPPPALSVSDQFAYRPTGSTTAAIITILHTVTQLLASNPHVIVIAIDFSKAFHTVWHKTLLDKMSQLDIPDNIFRFPNTTLTPE